MALGNSPGHPTWAEVREKPARRRADVAVDAPASAGKPPLRRPYPGSCPRGYREAVSPRSPRNTRSGALPAPRRSPRNASCGAGTPPPPASSPGPARGNRPADIITPQRGRQLDQQHRPLITQLVPAPRDALQPSLRRVELAGMGQTARCLDRQPEAARQSVPPAAERRGPGPAIEAAVELGSGKGVGVAGEPGPWREAPAGTARGASDRNSVPTCRS